MFVAIARWLKRTAIWRRFSAKATPDSKCQHIENIETTSRRPRGIDGQALRPRDDDDSDVADDSSRTKPLCRTATRLQRPGGRSRRRATVAAPPGDLQRRPQQLSGGLGQGSFQDARRRPARPHSMNDASSVPSSLR